MDAAKRRAGPAVCLVLAAALGGAAPAGIRAADTVTVFAAASTADALDEVGRTYAAEQRGRVVPVIASSSTLARQIEQGSPADVFVSADARWMDDLQERGLIDPATRSDLLGNRLVLIAPRGEAPDSAAVSPALDLPALLGDGRLAVGDPGHVPAGLYARQALESLGLWGAVADRLAPAADVRRALALVARGEAPLGIVYATDAAASDRVVVVGAFPADSHDPIVYPAAAVAGSAHAAAARDFLAFLHSPAAAAVFTRHGFEVLP